MVVTVGLRAAVASMPQATARRRRMAMDCMCARALHTRTQLCMARTSRRMGRTCKAAITRALMCGGARRRVHQWTWPCSCYSR